jgi:phospholipid transport system transporter-binding protein
VTPSAVQLPAIATLDEAAALAATLSAALAEDSGPLRIDASALQSFDTSTIALLLQGRRLAQAAGRGFEVIGAPAKLRELARLYGVEELLSLAPSATAA